MRTRDQKAADGVRIQHGDPRSLRGVSALTQTLRLVRRDSWCGGLPPALQPGSGLPKRCHLRWGDMSSSIEVIDLNAPAAVPTEGKHTHVHTYMHTRTHTYELP